MKEKILILCLAFFMFFTTVNATELPEVTDHEIVKVYLFWRDGCSYCEALIESLNEVEETYLDYFEIITIDVYEGTNGNLYDYISELLGDSGYVPYTVIGENHVSGYDLDSIIEYALAEYQNEDYDDVLGDYIDVTGGYDIEDLEYACDYKGIDYWNASEEDSSTSSIVVAGICILVIGVLGYLIISPKKNVD